jgi:hypothetical protein
MTTKKVTKVAPATTASQVPDQGETGPPPTKTAPEPAKLVRVRSPAGGLFWERHPAHPNGEVWVAGHDGASSPAVQVAKTEAVQRALKGGRLELVRG